MELDDKALQALQDEIGRQRERGVPLREQWLWRIGELTNAQSIDLVEHIGLFPELLDGFSVPGLKTGLAGGEEGSIGSLEDGGSLVVAGYLHDPAAGELVAKFKRRLQLDLDFALHEMLEVVPAYRGRGIGVRFLRNSFNLYDELGLREVHLQASLATGTWFWALIGFEFTLPADCRRVREWAREVCGAIGEHRLNLDNYASAAQFARMGGNRSVSMAEIARAQPVREKQLELLAEANGLKMDQRIELGRAVLLSGPDWNGRLQLDGPPRLAFEIYADAKEERLRRAAQEKRST